MSRVIALRYATVKYDKGRQQVEVVFDEIEDVSGKDGEDSGSGTKKPK